MSFNNASVTGINNSNKVVALVSNENRKPLLIELKKDEKLHSGKRHFFNVARFLKYVGQYLVSFASTST